MSQDKTSLFELKSIDTKITRDLSLIHIQMCIRDRRWTYMIKKENIKSSAQEMTREELTRTQVLNLSDFEPVSYTHL